MHIFNCLVYRNYIFCWKWRERKYCKQNSSPAHWKGKILENVMSCIVRIDWNLIYNSIQDSVRSAGMMKRLWVIRSNHRQVRWPNSRFVHEFRYTNTADGRFASINLNPFTNKRINYIQINLKMRLFFHTIHIPANPEPSDSSIGCWLLSTSSYMADILGNDPKIWEYYLINVQSTC